MLLIRRWETLSRALNDRKVDIDMKKENMKHTEKVEQAVKQAIENSKGMDLGSYQFSDFLNDQNNKLGLSEVEKKTAEFDFFYTVKEDNVPNVKFIKKANGISSIYEKY